MIERAEFSAAQMGLTAFGDADVDAAVAIVDAERRARGVVAMGSMASAGAAEQAAEVVVAAAAAATAVAAVSGRAPGQLPPDLATQLSVVAMPPAARAAATVVAPRVARTRYMPTLGEATRAAFPWEVATTHPRLQTGYAPGAFVALVGSGGNPHAVLHAQRRAAYSWLDALADAAPPGHYFVDVGGRPDIVETLPSASGRWRYMCPLLMDEDNDRFARSQPYVDDGKACRCALRCTDGALDARCHVCSVEDNSATYVFMHSAYYISRDAIVALAQTNRVVIATHRFDGFSGEFAFRRGTHERISEARWTREADLVTMTIEGNAYTYSHSSMAWLRSHSTHATAGIGAIRWRRVASLGDYSLAADPMEPTAACLDIYVIERCEPEYVTASTPFGRRARHASRIVDSADGVQYEYTKEGQAIQIVARNGADVRVVTCSHECFEEVARKFPGQAPGPAMTSALQRARMIVSPGDIVLLCRAAKAFTEDDTRALAAATTLTAPRDRATAAGLLGNAVNTDRLALVPRLCGAVAAYALTGSPVAAVAAAACGGWVQLALEEAKTDGLELVLRRRGVGSVLAAVLAFAVATLGAWRVGQLLWALRGQYFAARKVLQRAWPALGAVLVPLASDLDLADDQAHVNLSELVTHIGPWPPTHSTRLRMAFAAVGVRLANGMRALRAHYAETDLLRGDRIGDAYASSVAAVTLGVERLRAFTLEPSRALGAAEAVERVRAFRLGHVVDAAARVLPSAETVQQGVSAVVQRALDMSVGEMYDAARDRIVSFVPEPGTLRALLARGAGTAGLPPTTGSVLASVDSVAQSGLHAAWLAYTRDLRLTGSLLAVSTAMAAIAYRIPGAALVPAFGLPLAAPSMLPAVTTIFAHVCGEEYTKQWLDKVLTAIGLWKGSGHQLFALFELALKFSIDTRAGYLGLPACVMHLAIAGGGFSSRVGSHAAWNLMATAASLVLVGVPDFATAAPGRLVGTLSARFRPVVEWGLGGVCALEMGNHVWGRGHEGVKVPAFELKDGAYVKTPLPSRNPQIWKPKPLMVCGPIISPYSVGLLNSNAWNMPMEEWCLRGRHCLATPEPTEAGLSEYEEISRGVDNALYSGVDVRPVPLQVWLADFKPSRRVELEQAHTEWMRDPYVAINHSVDGRKWEASMRNFFIKVEQGAEGKAPRGIQAKRAVALAPGGPWFKALPRVMAKRGDGTRSFEGTRIIFGLSRTKSESMRLAMEAALKGDDCVLICGDDCTVYYKGRWYSLDAKRWDAHVHRRILEAENRTWRRLGCPRLALRALDEGIARHGYTRCGLEYFVDGTQASGDEDTIQKNTHGNTKVILGCVRHARRTGLPFAAAVHAFALRVGIEYEFVSELGVAFGDNAAMHDVEFCSAVPVLLADGSWGMAPKIGKVIGRFGLCLTGHLPEVMLRAKALSLLADAKHSSVLTAFAQVMLARAGPGKVGPCARERSYHSMTDSDVVCDPEYERVMCVARYGLALETVRHHVMQAAWGVSPGNMIWECPVLGAIIKRDL